MAGSSVNHSVDRRLLRGEMIEEHTFEWTADDANGSVPATQTSGEIYGFVTHAITNPGATAPTDNYDIVISDEDGLDIFTTNLTNRDTANSEIARPGFPTASDYAERFVNSKLTFTLTGNSVNDAVGVCKLYVRQP